MHINLRLLLSTTLLVSAELFNPQANATPPQSGWWWNPAEGGRGFAIEVQNGVMFMAGFMYDSAGNPTWYTSGPTPMSSDVSYQGVWVSYGGGQTLNGPYKGATITNSAVGSIQMTFTSPTSGSLQLPNGTVIPLSRFQFSGASTGPGGAVSATCASSNFTVANFNSIKIGMTLEQVNQTMGCAYNPNYTQRGTGYVANSWVSNSGQSVLVFFDVNDATVTPLAAGVAFKTSNGF